MTPREQALELAKELTRGAGDVVAIALVSPEPSRDHIYAGHPYEELLTNWVGRKVLPVLRSARRKRVLVQTVDRARYAEVLNAIALPNLKRKLQEKTAKIPVVIFNADDKFGIELTYLDRGQR